jgi:hypothetical protein
MAADRVIGAVAHVTTAAVMPKAIAGDGGAGERSPAATDSPAGAALIVAGAYYLQNDRLEFHARILEGETGRLLHALDPVTGPLDASDEAFERLGQRVAGAVAIHFDEFFGGLHIVSHAPTLDAYREYRGRATRSSVSTIRGRWPISSGRSKSIRSSGCREWSWCSRI